MKKLFRLEVSSTNYGSDGVANNGDEANANEHLVVNKADYSSNCISDRGRTLKRWSVRKVVGGIGAIVLIAAGVLYACHKDGAKSISKNDIGDNMRHFPSWEAVYNEVNTLFTMSREDLTAYEQSIGFQSFGSKANAIYYPIAESIMENNIELDVDKAMEYISQYPQYLQLVNEDGENSFIPKYDCNPFRYVMNNDRMFRVGDSVYKVFDCVLLGIPAEKAESLFNITDENIEEVVNELLARASEEGNGETPNEPVQKSTQKPHQKFYEMSLYLQGYFGGVQKNAGWKGNAVQKPIGGYNGGGPIPDPNSPTNSCLCPNTYGSGQSFTTSKATAPSGCGVVRAVGNVWIDILIGAGSTRFVPGWLYIRTEWHGGDGNSELCWMNVEKSMSGNITMEICVDGNRYLSDKHTISGYQKEYQRQIINTTHTSRPYCISITKINGQVCIPETCVTIDKNVPNIIIKQ